MYTIKKQGGYYCLITSRGIVVYRSTIRQDVIEHNLINYGNEQEKEQAIDKTNAIGLYAKE
jgi:hypothetical protein